MARQAWSNGGGRDGVRKAPGRSALCPAAAAVPAVPPSKFLLSAFPGKSNPETNLKTKLKTTVKIKVNQGESR
jgi:hypothetical protein